MVSDAQAVGRLGAELVRNRLVSRHRLVTLLPTGSTPLPLYAHLRRLHAQGGLPARSLTALQLDEYLDLAADDPRSYRSFMRRELGALAGTELHGPDAWTPDPKRAAADYERLIAELGGVDLALLGIGRNGHIAFNEPPAQLASRTHVAELSDATRRDAAGDFGALTTVPERALTVGIDTIMAAREVLLLAWGARKAQALEYMLRQSPDPACPASLLLAHPRLSVICDREAARLL